MGHTFHTPHLPIDFPFEQGAWLVILTSLVGHIRLIREVILSDGVGIVRVDQLGSIIILQIARV